MYIRRSRHPSRGYLPSSEYQPPSSGTPRQGKIKRPSQEDILEYLNRLDPAERAILLEACAVAREQVPYFNALVLRNESRLDEDGLPSRITLHKVHLDLLDFIERTRRGVVLSAPRMGKSQQGTIMYPLWRIGKNISTRTIIVSSVQELAKPFISSQQQYFVESIEMALIFPDLIVGNVWSALRADIRSLERETRRKDPSIRGMGARGRVTGGRVDLLLGDDTLDQENTRTEQESDKVYHWFLNAESRVTPKTGKAIMFANPWEEYDAAHKLIHKNKWDAFYLPAADENWKPVWEAKNDEDNEGWTQNAIDIYDPIVKERHLRLRARRREDVIFHVEDLEKCKRESDLVYTWPVDERGRFVLPPECRGAIGVDFASRNKERADWTVFLPMISGPAHAFGIREAIKGDISKALWCDRRKIEGPAIIEGILQLWARYGLPFVAEDNGAQIYLTQLMREIDPEIPIVTFTTTAAKKNHPEWGIRTIAAEYNQGRHILATDEHGKLYGIFEKLYQEMSLYDERVGVHTGDCLMAYWFARSYLRGAFGMRRFGVAGAPLTPADYAAAGVPQPRQKIAGSQKGPNPSRVVTQDGQSILDQIGAQKQSVGGSGLSLKGLLNSLTERGRR